MSRDYDMLSEQEFGAVLSAAERGEMPQDPVLVGRLLITTQTYRAILRMVRDRTGANGDLANKEVHQFLVDSLPA